MTRRKCMSAHKDAHKEMLIVPYMDIVTTYMRCNVCWRWWEKIHLRRNDDS